MRSCRQYGIMLVEVEYGMKIRILGSADMNSACFSASYLINDRCLMDIPEGTSRQLRLLGIQSESIEAVLLTHLHGDHTLGLPVWALKKTKMSPPPQDGSICICADRAQKDALEHLIHSSFPTSFSAEKTGRFFRWVCESQFDLGGLHIQRIPVRHGALPDCFGYLVSDGSVTVGFTGDACLCDGVREILSAAELTFCDCDLITGNEKHMGIGDLEALAEEYPGTRIVASHLKDETRQALLQMQPKGIAPATDGAEWIL